MIAFAASEVVEVLMNVQKGHWARSACRVGAKEGEQSLIGRIPVPVG